MLGLLCAIFLERSFVRALLYAVAFNLIIVWLNVSNFFVSSTLFIFGVICFPAIFYYAIKQTHHRQELFSWKSAVLSLSILPLIFYFFYQLTPNPWPYFIFATAILFMISSIDALKLILLFDAVENALLLLAFYFAPYPLHGIFALEMLIEFATFLPLTLLCYLAIQSYKLHKSLRPWQA